MRLARAAAILALGGYALCAVGWWPQAEYRPEWDSAIYVLVARSLAAGEGYAYQGEPFVLKPPGLPLLLAASDFPDVDDALALHRMIMAWAAFAVIAVYLAFARDFGRGRALAVALLTGTSPVFVERFNWLLADLPYIALLYAGFALYARAPARSGTGRGLLAGGAALAWGAAGLMRSAALLVVPAVVLPGLMRRGRDRRLALAAGAATLALFLPWMAWTRLHPPPAPLDQLLVSDYMTAVVRADPGNPDAGWLPLAALETRIERNAGVAIRSLGRTVTGLPLVPTGAVVIAGVLAGLVLTVRRRGLAPWDAFGLLHASLLMVYIPHDARLWAPVVPLVYLYLLGAIASLAERIGGPVWRARAPAATAVLLLAWNAIQLPVLLETTPRSAAYGGLARVTDWIEENTGKDAVILCDTAPIQSMLTGRRAYTHRFRPGPALLERYHPDVVVFEWSTPAARRLEPIVAARAMRRHLVEGPPGQPPTRIYELRPQSGAASGSASEASPSR